jgi:hypothetical protein
MRSPKPVEVTDDSNNTPGYCRISPFTVHYESVMFYRTSPPFSFQAPIFISENQMNEFRKISDLPESSAAVEFESESDNFREHQVPANLLKITQQITELPYS